MDWIAETKNKKITVDHRRNQKQNRGKIYAKKNPVVAIPKWPTVLLGMVSMHTAAIIHTSVVVSSWCLNAIIQRNSRTTDNSIRVRL